MSMVFLSNLYRSLCNAGFCLRRGALQFLGIKSPSQIFLDERTEIDKANASRKERGIPEMPYPDRLLIKPIDGHSPEQPPPNTSKVHR